MTQPFPYNPAYFERSVVPAAPKLGEVVGAQLGYTYSPIITGLTNQFRYGTQREQGYNPREDAGEYIAYPDAVLRAVNPQHMAAIKRSIDDLTESRRIMSEATLGQNLVAGIVDPVNLFALPFGGPTVGIGRSALRVGAGVGAIQAGLEATALPFDPLRTYEESALNIATASIFGGAIGATFGAGLTSRARSWNRTQEQLRSYFDNLRKIEAAGTLTRDDIAAMQPRTDRPLGSLTDAELNGFIARADADAENLRRSADPEQQGFDIGERADEILAESAPYRKELGYRSLESNGFDAADPYNIAPSWFTDSALFKAVTTPLKRTLQGKYPSAVKERFVKLASDAGIALNLNQLGIATPQSVFQRAAVSQGRWVAAHEKLLPLWSSDTAAPNATTLDINFGDIARRATGSPDTYSKWLQRVSEKRIKGDTNLTENEIKAIEVINTYFKNAETRLEEVGLIGNSRGIRNQISRLEAEINGLRADFDRLQNTPGARAQREAGLLRGRIGMLEARLQERQEEASALAEFDVNPERSDAFFPRFWDTASIRKNRQEFTDILFNWYKQNPKVIRYEDQKFVEVALPSDDASVLGRVNQTINTILGEKDPTNVDNIGFGYGRSKHFRHRQVDIPNKLVMKFMVTDPLAVMKTYASRIEPRYEYARMFGKDHDAVVFDMRREMVRAGKSDAEIASALRDYNHLYDRIAGAVIRNPDALSQRVAFALKEAASFNYMGSAGISAIPDFGRIVMEFELENVIKGVQTLVDKNTVKMTVDEIRLAGEAIDILRGSAHLRLMEGMANDINANEILTQARNAFYILNGLAPMTTIAKQLAGIIDAHTIIDYSIKLAKGQLDDKSRVWLARYGIDDDMAAKIARAPWQINDKGLYMANTEQWADSIFIPEIDGQRVKVIELNEDGTPVGKTRSFNAPTKPTPNITWDTMKPGDIVTLYRGESQDNISSGDWWTTNPTKAEKYGALRSFSVASDDLEKVSVRGHGGADEFYFPGGVPPNFLKSKQVDRYVPAFYREEDNTIRFDRDYIEGPMFEEKAWLNPKMEGVDALPDIFKTPKQWSNFVMLHEIMHSRSRRIDGETTAQYENRINQMALEDYRRQQTVNAETVESFRVALNSGVLNTIMSGTPADKPIIVDGVVYLPSRIGKRFGFDEDPRNPGYVRIENGFLGLPFQFYAFALANVNKTVGALAQGTVKNRAIGVTTMLGLAYMSMQLRTPDAVWQQMDWKDKFARSYDMSGITALYSDLFYTAMHTSLALGGPNITGGLLSPRYPQQPSMADALNGFAGAGPSWATDMAVGIYKFAEGDYGEGSREIVRNLPFARMWFWKDEVNQISRSWAQ